MRRLTLRGPVLGCLGLLALSSCDNVIPGDHRLTSLRMSLTNPMESELGTPGTSVTPASLHFGVEALDEQGVRWPTDAEVQAFLVAGGSRLPLADPCGTTAVPSSDPDWLLSRFLLSAGVASSVSLPLSSPQIFGRLTLNLEEPKSQAEGATPPIFFPNPTIARIAKPLDVNAANASFCSPYLGRQVVFERSAAPTGKLIVSSLFQNAIAISDTASPEYGSMYVFTFSRPSTELAKGRLLDRVSGAVAKFNGMTQLANPTVDAGTEIHPELVPAPVELDPSRRPNQTATSPENQWLTKYIAAPVRITGIVCETVKDQTRADNWSKYNTIVINQTGDGDPASVNGCGGVNSTAYIAPTRFSVAFPGKGVGGFDPATQAGKEVTILGMLQNGVSKSGKTLFWTVSVRDQTDVCLQPRASCPNAQ